MMQMGQVVVCMGLWKGKGGGGETRGRWSGEVKDRCG